MKYRQALDFQSRNVLTYTIPFNDQIAKLDVNIDDYIIIGENVESNVIVSLSDCFYKSNSILIQTMCMLMGQAEGTLSKLVIDLKTIFLPLLLIR